VCSEFNGNADAIAAGGATILSLPGLRSSLPSIIVYRPEEPAINRLSPWQLTGEGMTS
jgi:hypothetical protein